MAASRAMDAGVISLNEFGLKLLLAERRENSEKNVLFSSFSIAAALSMLYAGTKGITEKQIRKILNLKNDRSTHEKFRDLFKSLCSSTDAVLNIANLLVVDANYDIHSDFSKCLALNYFVETKQFNFESEGENARKEINKLIETATKGKIKDMLAENSIGPDTKLMLTNAIYFKGKWSLPFDNAETSKKPFYTMNGEEIMIDMMFRKNYYKYCNMENLKVAFLEIPYVGNKFSMLIILPKERNGLSSIEKCITVDDINRGIGNLREKEISLHLPKFKLEESFPLKDRLIQLGIVDAFVDNADLSGISGKKDLQVSDAIHKASVEVNEEGTEAAAATAVHIILNCYRPPFNFVVDHPFMFIIREITSRLMLFTGSVYKL